MKLAIVGLGEAGAAVAVGAAAAGAAVRGFDPRSQDPALRDHFAAVAEAGVDVAASLGEAVGGAEIVLSFVSPSSAVAVAEEAAAGLLVPGQVYVDANSVAPDAVARMAEAVEPTGAGFVDAAVMAAVLPFGHRVPMLLSGRDAGAVARRLRPLGFAMTVVGDSPGAASAAKMVRSVVVKGIEALLLEALAGASSFGVAGPVLDSLDVSFPAGPWRERADYFAGRTARHGRRRADELQQAAAALRSVGVEPLVTEASAQRIRRAADLLDGTTAEPGYAAVADLVLRGDSHDAS